MMNSYISSKVIHCVLFLSGSRRKPRRKFFQVLDSVMEPILELALFVVLAIGIQKRAEASLGVLILHASNLIFLFATMMARRWARSRYSALSELINGSRIPLQGFALLGMNLSIYVVYLYFGLCSTRSLFWKFVQILCLLVFTVQYSSITFLVVLSFIDASNKLIPCTKFGNPPIANVARTMGGIVRLKLVDGRAQANFRGPSYQDGDEDHSSHPSALKAFEQNCRTLSLLAEKLGGIHDQMLLCAFAVTSLQIPMLLMSACELHVMTLMDNALLWAPLLPIVISAHRINELMTKYRARIRPLWLKLGSLVHLALNDKFSMGFRWMADERVMDLGSAMSLVHSVMIYSSLVLTTPLFKDNDAFSYICH